MDNLRLMENYGFEGLNENDLYPYTIALHDVFHDVRLHTVITSFACIISARGCPNFILYAIDFLTPFFPYIPLISVFHLIDGAARILPPLLSFYLRSEKLNTPERVATGIVCVRESAHGGGGYPRG